MSMVVFLNRRFAKDPFIVFRKIADEFILVPIKQRAGDVESIYTINEVGGRIWELIDGKNYSGNKECSIEEFEVGSKEAETDLTEFIEQLEQIGAVRAL
jgi:hypothetical protein